MIKDLPSNDVGLFLLVILMTGWKKLKGLSKETYQ